MPTIHFISDLHLQQSQSHLSELFFYYMQNIAPSSEKLFVLGDLFEVWVGDDHLTDFNQKIIQQFNAYSSTHGELYVAHGNRDFLLGEKFARLTGAQLIEEPFELTWQDKKIYLMHGDVLCTDDIEYQKFRSMVRDPVWQKQLLEQPLEVRLKMAGDIREQSKQAQMQKVQDIMDVNQQAVATFFSDNQCDWLIHGHTHREAKHSIELSDDSYNDLQNSQMASRIVLSDWQQKGHYLTLDETQLQSIYFDLQGKLENSFAVPITN